MSYKQAADQLSFRNRTANHSTKPRKTGDNSHLVGAGGYDVSYSVEAATSDSVEITNLKTEKNALINLLSQFDTELRELNDRRRYRLPDDEYGHVMSRRKEIIEERLKVMDRLREIRAAFIRLRASGKGHSENREQLFIAIAQRVLPKDVYRAIWEEVKRAYGGSSI